METAKPFWMFLDEMPWDERDAYLMNLAKWWLSGMTFIKIAELTGFTPKEISKYVNPHVAKYHKLLDNNFAKLEGSLKRNDPDYDYLTDPRTVTQQMCALVMGGDEIKQTLEQLCNL